MRIDKYLKVTRLIKRREIAKQLCDSSYVQINGKIAKAMSEVNAGDHINIKLGDRLIKALVLEIREFANKEQASSMYQIEK